MQTWWHGRLGGYQCVNEAEIDGCFSEFGFVCFTETIALILYSVTKLGPKNCGHINGFKGPDTQSSIVFTLLTYQFKNSRTGNFIS